MDQISRQHPQLDRTLLRLQFTRQALKCHELLVQDTSAATDREAGAPITVLLLSAREGWSILTSEQ
jgi:hypothetical protein